ncbi:hypothetical protein [Bradyrhizobium japonicum]|uniref:hypothetical protein n=1 Tax=Bradyrhizobium japonicum TaxID=375 RepID=UPI000456A968|nr:hypothetical protein [Bradyrhizobium japonicum]AHY52479.1 hypothetical protein BJS_05959 [Bradyrhizobium japonicum SEMIA 5079]MCD9895110.1 hypothetical protein [Bradyrhizobium japonicum]WLB26802.1 hypothetical protein QIH85_33910 [Bradyrhizobium japonicum]WRJ81804.1 hypothetical protein R3F78_38095 [Bradyrhizobium japonicum]WRJ90412.1 hypothetical protein R3F77_33680 [Bradyrhizobium japonicum]
MTGYVVADHALLEVQAARRDLSLTAFCVRHAEALRRMDIAKTSLAHLLSGIAGHTGLLTSANRASCSISKLSTE